MTHRKAAFADRVLAPGHLREILAELRGYLKSTRTRQDENIRVLQKVLSELETSANRLFEAVEKGLLPMDDMLKDRAQKIKSRREALMIQIAGARRQGEIPVSTLSPRQVEAFGASVRERILSNDAGIAKRYLRQFVSEIRFDGLKVVMHGKKTALMAAAAEKEMGTAGVPISSLVWLPNLGSNQGPTD